MLLEVRADQRAVPGPAVLGVGCGVHAGEAAARADVTLERGLLGVVQDVTRGGHEDHDFVPGEVRVGESGRVLRRVDREVVLLAELLDCGDAVRDGVVPETGGLGEHKRPERRIVLGRCGGDCCHHR
jgi:hypothetical protein